LPDSAYDAEVAAGKAQGLPFALIDFEALVNDRDPAKAVRRVVAPSDTTLGVYRGWMLKPPHYEELYRALLDKHIRLINSPEAYRHCHYLPESYPWIASQTAESVWMECTGGVDFDRVMALLAPLGGSPVIVKDFVKSRKHEWSEACFIPSTSDRQAVERVVRRFVELQGDDLAGGLVFRRFLDLDPIGVHPKSGMPLTREFRIFVLGGQTLACFRYRDEGTYGAETPPLAQFTGVMRNIRSRFYTMDVARQRTGGWVIMELGDGQVAGLPENADVGAFYASLTSGLSANG
jgi:hypothetical protein